MCCKLNPQWDSVKRWGLGEWTMMSVARRLGAVRSLAWEGASRRLSPDAGPLTLNFQPPELWEINFYSLQITSLGFSDAIAQMARDATSRHFWMCAQRDTCLCAQGLVSRLLIEVLSMTTDGYSLCIHRGRMATTYIKCYLHMAQSYMAAQKTESETSADQISKSIQWKKWVATWNHYAKNN